MVCKEIKNTWLKKVLACSFSILFFLAGCAEKSGSSFSDAELKRVSVAQKIQLIEQAGGLVLVVGGETITSDEILRESMEYNNAIVPLVEALGPDARKSSLEQFKRQARPQVEEIVTARISDILLYHLTKSKMGKQFDEALEKAVEAEMRKFVLNFGGDEARADEELERMGMDRESFKKHQRKLILRNSEITSKFSDDSPITYGELMECYDRMKDESFVTPARVRFRLIDIQLADLEVADPNKDRRQLAKDLADRLLSQIKAGDDFADLAAQYQDTKGLFFGLYGPIQPENLAAPYDKLVDEIEKTEAGEVAGPMETSGHIFIMKVEEKHPKSYEPFEKVQRQVEQEVLSERWDKVIGKIRAELEEQASFGEKDEFIDFCLEKIYQESNQ